MGVGIEEDPTGPREDQGMQAELVCHRARDHEHAVLAASDVGNMCLEVTRRDVLSKYVITQCRFHYGCKHAKTGPGDHIACKISACFL